MLENNGNPFIRNKKGETIDDYLQKEACDAIIYQKLKDYVRKIQIQQNNILEEKPADRVHQSVIENNLKKLRLYRLLSASLESYNLKGEMPLEIAMKNDNLEIVLYLIEHTKNVFENMSLGPKVYDFLAKKIREKNELLPSHIKRYSKVWEKFLNYRDDFNLTGLDDECVDKVFRGHSMWESRKSRLATKSVKEKSNNVQQKIVVQIEEGIPMLPNNSRSNNNGVLNSISVVKEPKKVSIRRLDSSGSQPFSFGVTLRPVQYPARWSDAS